MDDFIIISRFDKYLSYLFNDAFLTEKSVHKLNI